ncbi:ribosomal RNA small subunit methyltransferase I [Clostridium sp. CAG:557]|nr:ribosomal RNA small subunit methyltransferase I [Clostridium sp. CAG:557]
MSGKLILVGTPIGNLNDMSPRAVKALEEADFIAAEDTRVTMKLLNHFGVKKPMISYFEHNKRQKGKYIVDRILSGEACVLVSDAGMPAISDPGEELVAQCLEQNVKITVVPGPSAVVSAVAISGLTTGRFTFEGFLSVNKKSRFEHLESVKNESRTMVFYEAPHKLLRTLKDFYKIFGNRKISIVRELTKVHEEVVLTTIKDAIDKYENEPIRGEFVLVVDGKKDSKQSENITLEMAVEMARRLLNEGYTVSDAAKQIAKKTSLKKSDIYKGILEV